MMYEKVVEITFRDTSEAALAYYAMKTNKLNAVIDWRLGWRRLYFEGVCAVRDIMADSTSIEKYINENDSKIVR